MRGLPYLAHPQQRSVVANDAHLGFLVVCRKAGNQIHREPPRLVWIMSLRNGEFQLVAGAEATTLAALVCREVDEATSFGRRSYFEFHE
jgi:hypothetical protein